MVTCSVKRIFYFGLIHYFCPNFIGGMCQVHQNNEPKIEVSVNELDKILTVHPQLTSYAIRKGIEKVTINCSYSRPVFWETVIAKAYIGKSGVSFYTAVNYDNKSSDSSFSYTISLTLEEFDDSITGRYRCTSIVGVTEADLDGLAALSYQIDIFGGIVTGSDMGSFSQRGHHFIIEDNIDDLNEWEYSMYVVLPCHQNYPTDILLQYDSSNYHGSQIVNYTQAQTLHEEGYCVGLFCADFKSLNLTKTLNIRNGFTITCSTLKSSEKNDSVVIVSPPAPEIFVYPKESYMNLTVSRGQKLIFSCQSTKPIRIETNYEYEYNIVTKFSIEDYYKYKSEIKISIPNSRRIARFHVQKIDWDNISMNISCNDHAGNQRHMWSYNISRSTTPLYVVEDNKIAQNLYHLTRGHCKTLNSNTAKVYFVPCSTYSECQMKGPLLYLSESEIKTEKEDHHVVKFKLLRNSSGMLRCTGFMRNFFSIFYPNIEEETKAKMSHYPIPSEKIIDNSFPGFYQSKKYYAPNPIVSVNASHFIEGDTIRIQCKIPLMIVVSHPVWMILFKNNSEHVILSENFIDYTTEIVEEIYVVSAALKIASINTIGVACKSTVLESIPPIIWKKGVLKIMDPSDDNEEPITTETRKGTEYFEVKASPQRESNIVKILGTTFGLLLLLVTVSAVWLYLRQRSLKNIVDRLTPEEIEYFLNGRPELISNNEITNNNAQNLAYDRNKEIPFSELEIEFKNILGSGEFGIVFRGYLKNKEKNKESLCVAIKTLKAGANVNYLKSAMAELKVLLFIKDHENVVGLIGACTESLMEHQLYIVMEFCSTGNLLEYLRGNGKNFVNEVCKGMHTHIATKSVSKTMFPDYRNIQQADMGEMTTSTLIHWTLQISSGMKYISGLNVIHGDLAARNILLDENLTAKISDFGLSKNLYQYSNYTRKGNVPLPWRWLAVESLNFTVFSLATDVWAYGITLWEIFSLGATPYPGQEFNSEFVKMLTNGFRLGLPEFCTYQIYNIIQDCWKKDPEQRPTFEEIHRNLDTMSGVYTHL